VTSARMSLLSEQDLYLFAEGTHRRIHEKLGAHRVEGGTAFAVWAPNARAVSVVGDFDGWDPGAHPLAPVASSGIWEGIVPGAGNGDVYKFHIRSAVGGHVVDKADPFAARSEEPPRTGSIVWDLSYDWRDTAWMSSRSRANGLGAPISIYEVHLGSSKRAPDGRPLTYREIAAPLADHVEDLGHQLGIEGAGDLVEQQQVRLHRQRPDDRDPLLLAAGQAIRELLALVGQAEAA